MKSIRSITIICLQVLMLSEATAHASLRDYPTLVVRENLSQNEILFLNTHALEWARKLLGSFVENPKQKPDPAEILRIEILLFQTYDGPGMVKLSQKQQEQYLELRDKLRELAAQLQSSNRKRDAGLQNAQALARSALSRLNDLEGRVIVLENAIKPRTWFSGIGSVSLLYASPPSLLNDAPFGVDISIQYNINRYVGVLAAFETMRLTAFDALQTSDGSSLMWDSLNLHMGGTASLIQAPGIVTVQLGTALGLFSADLRSYALAADRSDIKNGTRVGNTSSLYLLVKAELGVAPEEFNSDIVLSVGYMMLFGDVAYRSAGFQTNIGHGVWLVSIGVRARLGPHREATE